MLKISNHLVANGILALLELLGLLFSICATRGICSFGSPHVDVAAVVEPDFSIMIFEEFCFHLKHFKASHFLNVVTEF
jgi:hypothetical protein